MAFPTIVGTPTESATTTAGTTHTVNLPAGAAGNMFLLIMGKGTTSATINALAGWNELVDESQASGAFCAWRTCTGSEGATTAFTSSASTKSATIVYEITGQSNLAPEISAVGAASSNAPNPNTCTPTGGAKDYLWITWFCMGAASEEGDDDTWVNNAATGYANLRQKSAGTVGTNVGAAVASCDKAANAASDDASWPAASTDLTITWRAFTVAVHPVRLASIDVTPFTETGVLANLIADRVLSASPGSFALTGVDVTLLQEAAGTSLDVDIGAYSLTGVSASLIIDRMLSANAGSYSWTGVLTSPVVDRSLSGEVGSFAVLGEDVSLAIASLVIELGTIECSSLVLGDVRTTLLSRPKASWGGIGGGGRSSIITNRKKL